MSKDYYKILNVDKNASPEEIKKAFRRLAHQHHPDKEGGNEAKFKEINEAYQVLGNLEKREKYDQYGSSFEEMGGFGPGVGWEDFMRAARSGGATQGYSFDSDSFGLGDIFSDLFGFERGGRRTRQRKGEDVHLILTLEFQEAVFGVEKTIEFYKLVKCDNCQGTGVEPGSKIITCSYCQGTGQVQRQQNFIFGQFMTASVCPKCHGEGRIAEKNCKKCQGKGITKDKVQLKVKIPAGIDNNETIRLNKQGNSGEKGVLAGDLYLTVKVKPDPYFKRQEVNLLTKIEIAFSQAVIGDKIKVKTLEGEVTMKIPSGTKSGTIFRLRGHGVPFLRGHGRGDQLVEVVIKVPDKVSKEQKKILEDLKNSGL